MALSSSLLLALRATLTRLPGRGVFLLLTVCGLLLAGAGCAVAQALPARPNPPRLVNDLAGLLSADEVARLEAKLVAYDDSTSTQIAVVIVPTLGNYEVADYGQKIAQAWGVGQKGRNNGLLVLIAQQERKMHIATGYGTEERVTDYNARLAIEKYLKPAFREQRYYDGLESTTSALMKMLNGTFKAPPGYADRGPRKRPDDGLPLWVIVLIIVGVVWIISRRKGGGGGGPRSSRGRGGFFPPVIFGGGGFGGGFGGGGGGFGGGGGGGFGGFGGGSFGGGGASGDW